MTIKLTRCIEFVPKRHAFKARFYNSAEFKNWVDFGSVRGNFSYSLLLHSKSFCSQGALNLSYTKYPAMAIAIIINITFFINYFPNLILQAVLTQPLYGVMVMTNRYDNAHLCERQSKVYKFYDL